MKKNKINNDINEKESPSILRELIFGLFGALLGDATTKASWSVLLMIIGVVFCVNYNVSEHSQTYGYLIVGISIVILSIVLLIWRIREINKLKKNK
jgi:hypothetical protein